MESITAMWNSLMKNTLLISTIILKFKMSISEMAGYSRLSKIKPAKTFKTQINVSDISHCAIQSWSTTSLGELPRNLVLLLQMSLLLLILQNFVGTVSKGSMNRTIWKSKSTINWRSGKLSKFSNLPLTGRDNQSCWDRPRKNYSCLLKGQTR